LEADLHQMPKDAAHGEMPKEPMPVAETDPAAETTAESGADGDEKPETVAEGDFPKDMPLDLMEGDAESAAAEVPLDLGTKFVPQSPDATAKLMAGPKAQAAMKAAQAKLDAQARQQQKRGARESKQSALAKKMNPAESSDLKEASEDMPTDESSAANAEKVSSRRQNVEGENPEVDDRPLERPNDDPSLTDSRGEQEEGRDEAPTLRKFQEAAWFAKLPPELRKSLRANAQQRGPRAYEEKLRKYFESVD